jgi:23S rRNA (uracil1939-C5)-methyltransferase
MLADTANLALAGVRPYSKGPNFVTAPVAARIAERPMAETQPTYKVQFHDMAHGGEAVAYLPDGRAVFAAGVLPGEEAEIRLVHEKKKWARAEVLQILRPSEDRVDAACSHFGECGGCQWQHISIERQRQLKTEIVRGQLSHLGGIENPPVEDCRGVGEADGFGYRNHVVFSLDHAGHTALNRGGSRELIPIESCPQLHPLLRQWHEALPMLPGGRRLELRVGTRTGQRLAMVRGQVQPEAAAEAKSNGIPLTWPGRGEVTEMVHTERMRISSKSFFQVNTEASELLVDLVLEMLDPAEDDSIVDAYAGIGLFTLPLARRAAQIYAIERNAAAVRDLRFHVHALRDRVHVVGTPVEESSSQLPDRVHLLVADPPREGLGVEIATRFAAMKPRRIVLVSCDPAACARDVRAFCEAGYELERVVPVDQFPHTYHVEIVSELVRK